MKKIIFVVAAIQILTTSAFAALGDKIASVETDRKVLNLLAGQTSTANNFKFVEATSKNFTVRQFVAKNGSVFGVAWKGKAGAQLKQLLGTYYADYQKADAKIKTQLDPAVIRYRKVVGANVIVEQWNERRRVWGKAYSPALVPTSVTAENINMR